MLCKILQHESIKVKIHSKVNILPKILIKVHFFNFNLLNYIYNNLQFEKIIFIEISKDFTFV